MPILAVHGMGIFFCMPGASECNLMLSGKISSMGLFAGQPRLGIRAPAMRKLGHAETGAGRFFRLRYCATRKVDLETPYQF